MKNLIKTTALLIVVIFVATAAVRFYPRTTMLPNVRPSENLMPWSEDLTGAQCDWSRMEPDMLSCTAYDSNKATDYIYFDKIKNRISYTSVDLMVAKVSLGDMVRIWGIPDSVYDWNLNIDMFTVCWINKAVYVSNVIPTTPVLFASYGDYPFGDCYGKHSWKWHGFTDLHRLR